MVGAGNDFIEGEAGADAIDGGDGINTVTYSSSSAAVTVNLLVGTASGGDAQGDGLVGIGQVIGSGLQRHASQAMTVTTPSGAGPATTDSSAVSAPTR